MTTSSPSPWVLDTRPGQIDADPVETAAAIAAAMRRLAGETRTLTGLGHEAAQISDELLAALREMATVTTHLARLSFEHPTPPAPPGDLGAFPRRTPAARAADGFTDATNLIYLACQPLAGAQNETARPTAHRPTAHRPARALVTPAQWRRGRSPRTRPRCNHRDHRAQWTGAGTTTRPTTDSPR